MLAGLRPLLMPSRLEDAAQKVGFIDLKWLMVPGGQGAAEVTDEAVYLAISIRNVGTGIAVVHGWQLHTERVLGSAMPDPEAFTRLSRDLVMSPRATQASGRAPSATRPAPSSSRRGRRSRRAHT